MLINELAQWAVIAFLGILVLGLIRQLGLFIVPRKDQLLYRGPDIGSELPSSLLDGFPPDRLSDEIRRSTTGLGILAVINERCIGCNGLVQRLETAGWQHDIPLLAVVDARDPEFASRVEKVFPHVVRDDDLQRAKAIGITATPFILALDADLRVRHRGISGGLDQLVDEWLTPAHDHGNGSQSGHLSDQSQPLSTGVEER